MQWNIRSLVLGSIALGALGFSACSDDEDDVIPGVGGGTETAGTTSKGGATAKGGATGKGGVGNGGAATGGTTGVGGTTTIAGSAGTTAVTVGGATGVGGATTAAGGVGVGGSTPGAGGGTAGTSSHLAGNAGTAGVAGAPPLTNSPPVYPFSTPSSVGTNAWKVRENDNNVTGLLVAANGTTLTQSTDDGGVARWTVPFTAASQGAWVFTYQTPADLTGKIAKTRVRWTSGGNATGSTNATFQVSISLMDNEGFEQQDSAAVTLATIGQWVPINYVVPAAGAIAGWQPNIIGAITIKLYSGATGNYATGVFDIDFVTYE